MIVTVRFFGGPTDREITCDPYRKGRPTDDEGYAHLALYCAKHKGNGDHFSIVVLDEQTSLEFADTYRLAAYRTDGQTAHIECEFVSRELEIP